MLKEVVQKKRIFYGQADPKDWPPTPPPTLRSAVLWFFWGVHLTLVYVLAMSEKDRHIGYPWTPLAKNPYTGFKVVYSKQTNPTITVKVSLKMKWYSPNFGGLRHMKWFFLILLLLFCCFMCVENPTHLKYNVHFVLIPILRFWVAASEMKDMYKR